LTYDQNNFKRNANTDGAGRATRLPLADYLNLGGGTIGASTATLAPGVYTWESALDITGDITLKGGPSAVFIFQVNGTLDMASAAKIILSGGAQAKNIFWQVTDVVTLGTTSHFEGIILGQTLIALQTSASINGRTLAQTAVTLDQNTVTQPVNNIKGKGHKN
jgi:Ice-binding-like